MAAAIGRGISSRLGATSAPSLGRQRPGTGGPSLNSEVMRDTAPSAAPSRRGFLGLAAAAAGATLLSGCTDPRPGDAGFKAGTVLPTPYPEVDPVTGLNTVLAIEHQAVFAYNAVASLLSPAVATLAAGFRKDHETHRDALTRRVRSLGATPVAAQPTYDLVPSPGPQPSDETAALKVAADLEDTAAKSYYHVVAGTADAALRAFLVSIMGDEAQHSAILRAATGQDPVTTAFQAG